MAVFCASTSRITGEVRLVSHSPAQQAEDLSTQLTDLFTRLVVLGHLDVGDDARGALGQDDHSVGQAQGLVDVVGDQDGREALGLPQLDDLVLELEACQSVELAQGLVQEEEPGPVDQGPGQRAR